MKRILHSMIFAAFGFIVLISSGCIVTPVGGFIISGPRGLLLAAGISSASLPSSYAGIHTSADVSVSKKCVPLLSPLASNKALVPRLLFEETRDFFLNFGKETVEITFCCAVSAFLLFLI